MSIADRIEQVRERIASAAGRAGRDPASVRLVAVTKTRSASDIREAAAAGALDIGENKVQEAVEKQESLAAEGVRCPGHGRTAGDDVPAEEIRWHLIGHLQTNKARFAVRAFDLIHSVDSEKLAAEIDAQCARLGRERCAVLLQVNVSGESTKGGFEPDALEGAAERILALCPRLEIQGFMTMAPFELAADATRPHFRRLAAAARDLSLRFSGEKRFSGADLSMGMTNDFEVAVEEGATLVRIGSALFGDR